MSAQGGFNQSQVRASYRGASAQPLSIMPRIVFQVEITHTLNPGQNYNLTITGASGGLGFRGKDGNVYGAGALTAMPTVAIMSAGGVLSLQLSTSFDHYSLRRIEELRGGGDADFFLDLTLDVEVQTQPQTKGQIMLMGINAHVSKSDWVEKILPAMQFKSVSLVEIPQVKAAKFEDVASNLDSAWKEYMNGKYDDVLGDCRKTLEALKKTLRELGLVTKTEGEDVIDWKKLMGSDDSGEVVSTIFQKAWAFSAPGAHIGKAINREDGDFALLVTHAIVNLAVQKSKAS